MPLIGNTIRLIQTTITGRGGCAACADFTALGKNGDAGYLKMRHGAKPSAHVESGFSQLWFDTDGRLHVLQADGTDMKVAMDEDEQ